MKTRNLMFTGLALVVVSICGCAFLDTITGTTKEGERTGYSVVDNVLSPVANSFFPGSGMILTGLAGAWAAFRGRQWRKLASTTFDLIETGAPALKEDLNKAHEKAGVDALAHKLVAKYPSA